MEAGAVFQVRLREFSEMTRSACPLARSMLQPDARPVVVQKINAALFQSRLHFEQSRGLRADEAVKDSCAARCRCDMRRLASCA